MKNEYIIITTTFNRLEIANKVINRLLNEKLVSCTQMTNIKSTYHWTGKIESTDEIFVQMKSKKELYPLIEKIILEMHNYEIPQIVFYDIAGGLDLYLNWIGEETK